MNQLKALWREGRSALGGWCVSGSPTMAEALALEAYDYVCLDAQHGMFSLESVFAGLFAVARTGTTPIVRVPVNDPAWVGKVLDAGAHGVIVPMIETADDARAAVANCRIYPGGSRSYGPFRLSQSFGTDPAVISAESLCIVMIETALGVSNADEICSVPGVDGVYIGPADLAITYGLPPGLDLHPGEHRQAVETVIAAAHRHQVAVGIQCGTGSQAKEMLELGFNMVTVGADVHLLRAAVKAELAVARVVDTAPAGDGVYA